MSQENNGRKKKEPFVRMVKRDALSVQKAVGIRLIAIILALLVCSIFIIICTHCNPVQVFESMWKGTFGTTRRLWNTTRSACVLLCLSIALAPAFKMKFWNIGAEGQALIGGLVTLALMLKVGDQVPTAVLFLMMVLSSMAAGALWGMAPAIFKARWNTNETLFTLMMNYIAIQLVAFYSIAWESKKGTGNIGVVNQKTETGWITSKFLPEIFGKTNYSIILFIVLAATLFMFIYMKYTKHGYEIAVVGESENTARYAGINVKKTIIRTMALSGAFCGLAGFILVSGASHTISTQTVGGEGFTAIIVAWMAKFNPVVMILISFFLMFMQAGAGQIASDFSGFNESASDIMIGIILFFILGCELLANYRLVFRFRRREAK